MTPDWAEAACAGYSYKWGVNPDAFYPTATQHSDPAATELCNTCPIIDDCLQWALHHEAWGVWAGTFPEQRQTMRRRLNIVLQPPPGAYTPPCGTEAARRRHWRKGERICDACAQTDAIKRAERKARKERENTA